MKVECLEPGVSPVTLDEAKKHLRVTGDEFDDSIWGMVEAATSTAENITGLKFRKGTYKVTSEYLRVIRTELMPILSAEVRVDGKIVEGVDVEGSRIILPDMKGETVEITIQTGYKILPYDIRAAILLMAGKLFDNPSDSVENLPKASTNLLKHYRRWER